jgi:transposase
MIFSDQNDVDNVFLVIYIYTIMTIRNKTSQKRQTLQQQGSLNPTPDRVTDELFQQNDFFDPEDMVQVKYEMLRRVDIDKEPVGKTAAAFGLSRVTFYLTQCEFAKGGLSALVPKKRGPRGPHKLTGDVMEFILRERKGKPRPSAVVLSRRVKEQFELVVHPRTIERALRREEKKRQ